MNQPTILERALSIDHPESWVIEHPKTSIVRINNFIRIEQTVEAENIPPNTSIEDLERIGDQNAKLIAASIDMLKALISAQKYLYYKEDNKGRGLGESYPHPKHEIEAAINKATK